MTPPLEKKLLYRIQASSGSILGYALKKEKVLPKICIDYIKNKPANPKEVKNKKITLTEAAFKKLTYLKNFFSYSIEHLPPSKAKEILEEYDDAITCMDASIRGLESSLKSKDMKSAVLSSGSVMLTKLIKKIKYHTVFGKKGTRQTTEAIDIINKKLPEFTKLITLSVIAATTGYMVLTPTLREENSEQGDKKQYKKKMKKVFDQMLNTTGNLASHGTIKKVLPLIDTGRNAETLTNLARDGISATLCAALEYGLLRSSTLLLSQCGNYNFSPTPFTDNQCSIDKMRHNINFDEEIKNMTKVISIAATVICCVYLLTKIHASRSAPKL